MMDEYWFKSEYFKIEPGEDEETNPGCYGKHLAHWLNDHLRERGYASEVIPEDWGWCVMCKTQPFSLWVGCGSMLNNEFEEGKPLSASEVVWHCFVVVEVPFFKKILGKIDTADDVNKLEEELTALLTSTSHIEMTGEP